MSAPSMKALTTGTALRAATHALTKNGMRPRLIWCLSLKLSLYFALSAMTADISASLNVVSVAELFREASSFSAMRARIGLMRSRRSPAYGRVETGAAGGAGGTSRFSGGLGGGVALVCAGAPAGSSLVASSFFGDSAGD